VSGRRVVAVVVWWCVLWGLWFAYQGEWNRIEWVAAACAATLGSAVAGLLLWRGLLDVRVPLEWVAPLWKVPLQVVIDFGIVTVALVRALARRQRVAGSFVTRPFHVVGETAEARGIRGFVAVSATYSPNAYVVHVDAQREAILLHDLVVHRSSEEPVGR
jgi:hypothetical protein